MNIAKAINFLLILFLLLTLVNCDDESDPERDGYRVHGVISDSISLSPLDSVAIVSEDGFIPDLPTSAYTFTDTNGYYSYSVGLGTEKLYLIKTGYRRGEILILEQAEKESAFKYRLDVFLVPEG